MREEEGGGGGGGGVGRIKKGFSFIPYAADRHRPSAGAGARNPVVVPGELVPGTRSISGPRPGGGKSSGPRVCGRRRQGGLYFGRDGSGPHISISFDGWVLRFRLLSTDVRPVITIEEREGGGVRGEGGEGEEGEEEKEGDKRTVGVRLWLVHPRHPSLEVP